MNDQCGNCKYWHRGPANALDITAPVAGVCRHGPPQMLVVGVSHQGPQVQALYPMLPADHPQCSRFELSLVGQLGRRNGAAKE